MPTPAADLFAGILPFVATADALSITRAARALRVTPSAVSKALSRLEADLGVRLLNRTSRAVSLTEEGARFYRECHDAVTGVRTAREAVSQSLGAPRGRLRISLPLALGELVVMPALPRLLARHAGLSIEAALTDRHVDLVAEQYDAVVRIGRPRQSGLVHRRLPPVRWSTVAAPVYLARWGVPGRPQDLAKHNCLHFILANGTRQPWRFQARNGEVSRPPTGGNLASDSPGGLVQATLAGLGLLQAHRYIVARAVAEGRLVEVLSDHAAPPLPMAVFFTPGAARSPKIRVFVEAMTELLTPGF
jgi:LysR family transcriptional regulator, regulator for bpeEF and oprC